MTAPQSWSALLDQLLRGESLQGSQARDLMEAWLSEQLEPVQTGAFLAALRSKGMNGEELAAMAEVLRAAAPLPCARPDLELVDTCGTGGDGANTFNISTAVALWPPPVGPRSRSTETAVPAARSALPMFWKRLD